MAKVTATNIGTEALLEFLQGFEPISRKSGQDPQRTATGTSSQGAGRGYLELELTKNSPIRGRITDGVNYLEGELDAGDSFVSSDYDGPIYAHLYKEDLIPLITTLKNAEKSKPLPGSDVSSAGPVNLTMEVTDNEGLRLKEEDRQGRKALMGEVSVHSVEGNNVRFVKQVPASGESKRSNMAEFLKKKIDDSDGTWKFGIPMGQAAKVVKLKPELRAIIKKRADEFGDGAKYKLWKSRISRMDEAGEGTRAFIVPRQVPHREEYPKGKERSEMVFQLAAEMEEGYDHKSVDGARLGTSLTLKPTTAQIVVNAARLEKGEKGDLDPTKKSFPHYVVTDAEYLEKAFGGLDSSKTASSPVFVTVSYPDSSTGAYVPSGLVGYEASGGDGEHGIEFWGAFMHFPSQEEDKPFIKDAKDPQKDTSSISYVGKTKPVDRDEFKPYATQKTSSERDASDGHFLVRMKADDLVQALNQVKDHVEPPTGSRPVLQTVHFDMHGPQGVIPAKVKDINLVAADGYTLAVANMPVQGDVPKAGLNQVLHPFGPGYAEKLDEPLKFNLPVKELKAFIDKLGGKDRGLKEKDGGALKGDVSLFIDSQSHPRTINLVGENKKGKEVSERIEPYGGSFPNYRSLLTEPGDAKYLAKFNPKDIGAVFDPEGTTKAFVSRENKRIKKNQGPFAGYEKLKSNQLSESLVLTETPDGKLAVLDREAVLASGRIIEDGREVDFNHLVDIGKNVAIDTTYLLRDPDEDRPQYHVALNPEYLGTFQKLRNVTDDDITIFGTDEKTPITATTERNKSGIKYEKVLMPMFTNHLEGVPVGETFKFPEILNITHTVKDGELIPTRETEAAIKANAEHVVRPKWDAEYGEQRGGEEKNLWKDRKYFNEDTHLFLNPFLPSTGGLLTEEEVKEAIAKQQEGWPTGREELKKAKQERSKETARQYQDTTWPETKAEALEKRETKKPVAVKETESPREKKKEPNKVWVERVKKWFGENATTPEEIDRQFLSGRFDLLIAPGHEVSGEPRSHFDTNVSTSNVIREMRDIPDLEKDRTAEQQYEAHLYGSLGLQRGGAVYMDQGRAVPIGDKVPGLTKWLRHIRKATEERTRYLKDLENEVRHTKSNLTIKNPDRNRKEILQQIMENETLDDKGQEYRIMLETQRRAALNYADAMAEETLNRTYKDAILNNEVRKYDDKKAWDTDTATYPSDQGNQRRANFKKAEDTILKDLDKDWVEDLREAGGNVANRFTEAELAKEIRSGGTDEESPYWTNEYRVPSIRMGYEIAHQAERWEEELNDRERQDFSFVQLKEDYKPGPSAAWREFGNSEKEEEDLQKYLAKKGIGKAQGEGTPKNPKLSYDTKILKTHGDRGVDYLFMELSEEAKKIAGSKLAKEYKKFAKKGVFKKDGTPNLEKLEELENLAADKGLFFYHGTLGGDPVYVTDIVPVYGTAPKKRIQHIADFKEKTEARFDKRLNTGSMFTSVRPRSAIKEYIDAGVYKVLKWADENKVDSATDDSTAGELSRKRNPGLHVLSWKYPEDGKFPFKEGIPLDLTDREATALSQLTQDANNINGQIRFDTKTRNSNTTTDPVGYVMLGKGFKEFDGRGDVKVLGSDLEDLKSLSSKKKNRKKATAISTDYVVSSKDDPTLKGAIFDAWADKSLTKKEMEYALRPVEAYFPVKEESGETRYLRAQPDIPWDHTLNTVTGQTPLGPPNKIMVGKRGFIPYSRAVQRFAMAADVGYPHTVADIKNPGRWSGTGKPHGPLQGKHLASHQDGPKVRPGYGGARRYPRGVTFDASRNSPITGKAFDRRHFKSLETTDKFGQSNLPHLEKQLMGNYTGPDRVASYYWWLLPNRADIYGIDRKEPYGNILANLDSTEPGAPFKGKKAFVAAPGIEWRMEQEGFGARGQTATDQSSKIAVQEALIGGFTKRERGLMDQAVYYVQGKGGDLARQGASGLHRSKAFVRPYADMESQPRGNPKNHIQLDSQTIRKPQESVHKKGDYAGAQTDDSTVVHETIHLLRDIDDKRSGSTAGQRTGAWGNKSFIGARDSNRDQDLEEAMTDAETAARIPGRTTPAERVGGYYNHIGTDTEIREIPSSPLAPGHKKRVRVFNYERAPSDPNYYFDEEGNQGYLPEFRHTMTERDIAVSGHGHVIPGSGRIPASMLGNDGEMYDKMVLNQYVHPASKKVSVDMRSPGSVRPPRANEQITTTIGKLGAQVPKHNAAMALAAVSEHLGIMPSTYSGSYHHHINHFVEPLEELKRTDSKQYAALIKDLDEIQSVGLKSLQGNKAINRVRKVFPQLAISKMKLHGEKEAIDTYWNVEHRIPGGQKTVSRVHLRANPDQSTQTSRIDAVVPDLIREGASISVTEFRDGKAHPVKIPKSAQPKVRGQKKTRAPKKSARVQKPGKVQQYQDKITGKKYMRRKNGPMPTGKRFLALK